MNEMILMGRIITALSSSPLVENNNSDSSLYKLITPIIRVTENGGAVCDICIESKQGELR